MKIMKTTILGLLVAGTLGAVSVPASADDHDFRVPPGHMPPAGKCRIWYPGTPPGHQPPVGDCRTLSRQVPRGATLIGHDRRWSYTELHDRRFRHDVFDRPHYSNRSEIREDIRDVRQSRKDVHEDRQDLQKNLDELHRDRAELKKDIRSGASRKEIAQDRREIRDDARKVSANKKDLQQSQEKLQAARRELKEDSHRR
jgi:hypothetical protein